MKDIKEPNQLIQINDDGVYTARFADIRDCLEVKFKEIYGIDIDTDIGTADSQYINMWALLINNLFQLIQYGYKQTDPVTATGNYLNLLCAFNNIRRIKESKSKVNLWVKNIDSQDFDELDRLEFIDVLGRRWQWINPTEQFAHQKAIKFKKETTMLIRNVECLDFGPIMINGSGDFDGEISLKEWKASKTNATNHGYLIPSKGNAMKASVWQEKESVAGTDEESDDELRIRRNNCFINANSSVIDTLKGNLLALDGIDDCFIYENDTANEIDLKDFFDGYTGSTDSQKVKPHSIYICLKYDYGDKDANYISDYDIGNLIYSKLIPGCRTCKYLENVGTVGISGETRKYEVKTNSEVTYPIYWKKVYDTKIDILELNKGIKIILKCVKGDKVNENGYNFDTKIDTGGVNKINIQPHPAKTDVEIKIKDNILEYLNGIKIGETINSGVLANAIASADIKKNNMPTFFVESTKIRASLIDSTDAGVDNYILPLCTLNYEDKDIVFKYEDNSADYYAKCIIIIRTGTI